MLQDKMMISSQDKTKPTNPALRWTLLTAGFSRFGIGRQIVFAIALLVLIKLTESVMIDPVRANPNLWPLIYAPTLVGCLFTLGCLSYVARPPYRRVSKAAHR